MGILATSLNIRFNPVLFGPVDANIQGVMVSSYENKSKLIVDVMESFKIAFDTMFWVQMSLFLLLFLILLCIVSKMQNHRSWDVFNNIWHVVTMMIGQFKSCPQFMYLRTSIIIVIIFIDLTTITFLNLFLTTLVITPKPEVIDSFKDLVDKNITPKFLKQDSYWTQFSEAKSGHYKEVWMICKRNGVNCMISVSGFNLEVAASSVEICNSFIKGNSVFIIHVENLDGLASIIKGLKTDINLHIAKEQMKPDFRSFIYSKNVSKPMRHHMDMRFA